MLLMRDNAMYEKDRRGAFLPRTILFLWKVYIMRHSFWRGTMFLFGMVFVQSLFAVTKHEMEVFGKWHAWQQVYNDRVASEFKNEFGDRFVAALKEQYEKSLSVTKQLVPLMFNLTGGQIGSDGFQLVTPMNEDMKKTYALLYDQMENNFPAFIETLIRSNIAYSGIDEQENGAHYDLVIEKYKALDRLLFPCSDEFKQNEFLFSLANRMFECCYSDENFVLFQNILTNRSLYPLARFLTASIWYQLVGDGWKHWHANTLNAIKEQVSQGKEVYYLAGGTDIYRLLSDGIYNITVIDPFLPTQVRFYSEGWEFLIDSGLNDEIRFGPDSKSIKMKRIDFQEGELFFVKLQTNNIVTLRKNVITWHVFDRNDKQVGRIIFMRRPVVQADFTELDKRCFVMSYDEMAFLGMPDMLAGWGIEPTCLPADLTIYVKQLRKPVTRNVILNLRIAGMLNLSDLKFINIASDPT